MGSAEGVIDIELCQGSQFLGKFGVVLFLSGVEPHIFQQHDLTVLQGISQPMGIFADDVSRERHFAAQQLRKPCCHRSQAVLGVHLTLGASQMGAEDHPSALFHQIADGGQRLGDALIVGDGAAIQRHIEVTAHQDPLSLGRNIPDALLVQHTIHN